MPSKNLKTHLLAAVAVAAVSAPLPTMAAGFLLKEQSASGQGTSFAGVTANAAGDASAMFFNPAAMGALTGSEAVGVLSGIFPTSEGSNARATRATRLGGGVISGSTESDDIGIDAVLPAGYAVFAVSPDVKVGLAVTAPWGLSTDYKENWVGRYHGVHSSLRTYNISPTVSYQVLPQLTIAGGLQFQYASARLSQAVDFGSILAVAAPALGVRPGALDGMAEVKGDDWGFGVTAGTLYEPVKGTRFGLSWRSSVFHELEGDSKFEGVPGALRTRYTNSDVKAKVATPDIISFGAYHELNSQWAVMADAQWTNWSRFKELRIRFTDRPGADSVTEEHWKDSWFFALGTAYKWNEKLTLRAGVAYDQSPVPDRYRTPRIPDEDRYWVSLGLGYQVTDSIRTDVGYTHVFANKAKVDLRDNLTGADAFRGNLAADYKANVDIIAVQTKIAF